MNIVLRELRANVKSIVIWCSVFAVLVILYMTEFSAYAYNDEMLAVLDGMPEQLLEAFKMNSFNLTTLTGFYGILFTYFSLMLCIQAILKGNSIISKEERYKTVEFALALPVRRRRLITAKIIVAIFNCIAILGFLYGIILLTAQQYLPEENFMEFLWLLILSTFIMQMMFLGIGIMLGCISRNYKRSGYIGIALIITTYLFYIVSDLSDKLEFLKYLTPFKYFDTLAIRGDMALDWIYVAVSIGITAVCLAIAYITYEKRDMYI